MRISQSRWRLVVARDDSRCALRAGRARPRFHSHLAVHRSQGFFPFFFFSSFSPFPRVRSRVKIARRDRTRARTHTQANVAFNHTLETPRMDHALSRDGLARRSVGTRYTHRAQLQFTATTTPDAAAVDAWGKQARVVGKK